MKRTLSLIPLLLAMAAPPAAAQPAITPGQTLSGSLSDSDPTLDDGSHYDLYTFRASAGQRFRITLRSEDFDAYVAVGRIQSGECTDSCETDDDGAGGTDSRVYFTAPSSGIYQIRANSLSEGETGGYRLTLEEASTESQTRDIAIGQTVRSTLDEADPTAGDDSYYELWRVRVSDGERLTITLRSDDFDAYVGWGRMDGDEWEEIDSDDDGAGGTDSRLEVTAGDDGTYVIRANSLSGGETGDYTLTVERGGSGGDDDEDEEDCASGDEDDGDCVVVEEDDEDEDRVETMPVPRDISIGQTVSGELEDDDATLDDGSHYDLFSIRARAGQTLVITLSSDDFDAYLAFGRADDGEWEEIDSNDDGEEGTDSELEVTVPESGVYLIRANSLGEGETGAYVLRVRAS